MLKIPPATGCLRGFTLIEVMITLVVLGIAMSLGMPSYQTWIASTGVRTAAESILAGMQLARTEAIARNVAVTFRKDAATGSGWCVTLDPDSCDVPLHVRSAKDGSSAAVEVALSNGATQTVAFDGFGRLKSPAPVAGTAIRLDMTHATVSDARKLRVTVDIGGTARMCDPSVTSTSDTRICP